jgi:hypothetical protein
LLQCGIDRRRNFAWLRPVAAADGKNLLFLV